MPRDSTPRMVVGLRVMPVPGTWAPTGAKTPFMPVRALGAPQTTCTTSVPVSTRHSLRRSASGCGTASITSATMKGASASAALCTLSTSRPMRVSVPAISSSVAAVSRWSLSQERVNFIG